MLEEEVITPEMLLQGYAAGVFPMARSADDERLEWYDTPERGVFPLDGLKVSRSLAKTIRANKFRVTANVAFDDVVAACAASTPGRTNTWINRTIRTLYKALHDKGHAHSVECWQDDQLVGGLYGVSLAGAFFGESMFHRATDASKVALVHLVARLNAGDFQLLDAQMPTPHLASLGAITIPRARYHRLLDAALCGHGDFFALPAEGVDGGTALDFALRRVMTKSSDMI
jgi:leucyl/phenylalanyl-tRNA--protein transferase